MAGDAGDPTYLMVYLNLRCNFFSNPHGYVAERYLIADIDLALLDYEGCILTSCTTRKEIVISK